MGDPVNQDKRKGSGEEGPADEIVAGSSRQQAQDPLALCPVLTRTDRFLSVNPDVTSTDHRSFRELNC